MKRFIRTASFITGFVVFASTPSFAQSAEAGAKLYVDKCSACHSVGGGEVAGPDLINAAKLSDADLRASIHRMEDNVGTLTVGEVDSLVAFLKSPNIKDLVTAAQNPPPVAKVVEVERGSAKNGRALFYGDVSLANGGPPCFACHSVAGRGGNLAKDLTLVHARLNRAAIVSTTTKPAFPLMKSAYANHAITEQEALDVGAFLKESAATAKPGPQPQENAAGRVHRAAAGGAAVVLAASGLILLRRRAGVRSRMVHRRGGE